MPPQQVVVSLGARHLQLNCRCRHAQEGYFAARESAIYAWSLVGIDRRKTANK
jgi:hypothetical protein